MREHMEVEEGSMGGWERTVPPESSGFTLF